MPDLLGVFFVKCLSTVVFSLGTPREDVESEVSRGRLLIASSRLCPFLFFPCLHISWTVSFCGPSSAVSFVSRCYCCCYPSVQHQPTTSQNYCIVTSDFRLIQSHVFRFLCSVLVSPLSRFVGIRYPFPILSAADKSVKSQKHSGKKSPAGFIPSDCLLVAFAFCDAWFFRCGCFPPLRRRHGPERPLVFHCQRRKG